MITDTIVLTAKRCRPTSPWYLLTNSCSGDMNSARGATRSTTSRLTQVAMKKTTVKKPASSNLVAVIFRQTASAPA